MNTDKIPQYCLICVHLWFHQTRSSDMRAEKSRRRCRIGAALAAACAGLVAASAAVGDQPRARSIDFAHDIVPILQARCAECHTDGKYKGSFSLDTREAMLKSGSVVPGKSG